MQSCSRAIFALLLLTVAFPAAAAVGEAAWFRFGAPGTVLLASALAGVVRLKVRRKLDHERMRARKAERERIARELHDTLLQGTQALLMRIQNWETDPAIPESHRREVAAAVTQARSMVIEGRDLILGLREGDRQPADLVAAIAELERNEWAIEPPRFAITVIGRPKPVPVAALRQMLGIAREAIRNAYRHANARQLEAILEFGAGAMRMSFSDDGVGIEPSTIGGRPRPNHFGLVGMRERAEQLGATLVVGRNGARGTRVTLSMPLDTDA